MNNDDLQRMLKSAGITPNFDDSVVILDITEELLARLRTVHKEFEDLRLLCKRTVVRDDDEKFIKGDQYVVHRIWEDNNICVLDKDGEHCKVNGIEAIAMHFAFKTTQSQLNVIEKMAILSSKDHKNKLAEAAKVFLSETKGPFVPGMWVRWKRGIASSCHRPAIGEAAIVLEVLDEPIRVITDETVGTPVGGAKYDIVIGVLDNDGDLLTYLMDSRRFEPDEEIEGD